VVPSSGSKNTAAARSRVRYREAKSITALGWTAASSSRLSL
jgi:hypothetical protein